MTIESAIARVNKLRPNSVPEKTKVEWLSQVDGLVHREILLAHELPEEIPEEFDGYDHNTHPATVLLVPFPYDEIYIHWLNAQIDYAMMENDKYNNDRMLFNNAWDTFGDAWRRAHMPVQKTRELRI